MEELALADPPSESHGPPMPRVKGPRWHRGQTVDGVSMLLFGAALFWVLGYLLVSRVRACGRRSRRSTSGPDRSATLFRGVRRQCRGGPRPLVGLLAESRGVRFGSVVPGDDVRRFRLVLRRSDDHGPPCASDLSALSRSLLGVAAPIEENPPDRTFIETAGARDERQPRNILDALDLDARLLE